MFEGISQTGRKVLMTGTLAAVLASLTMTAPVAADDYPDRPVDMVVGFGTGGSADRMARAMSNFLAIEGLYGESKKKILWDNCARFYGL